MVYYQSDAMTEPKIQKSPLFREHTRIIAEIQATRDRNAEHFIKVFRHESDNVTGAKLGTLLGIFEIDDHSEDSKYIVNFLFSVAKNEYFCNPRRSTTDSFEAALHKINTALAEIVKHGNIGWLGKFHGTIAVLEKNTIHLSVAGDGCLYLSRSDTFVLISEGLASPEATEHPLKTFTETSSGQLMPGDRILFLLPKAVDMIGEATLERHAHSMDRERLSQFLRTAMINQLERGGAIVVDIEEGLIKETPPKEPARAKAPIQSYFSEMAFETKRGESIAAVLTAEAAAQHAVAKAHPEYTDAKTGHIYIHADQHAMPAEPSRFAEYSETALLALNSVWVEIGHHFYRLSHNFKAYSAKIARQSVEKAQRGLVVWQQQRAQSREEKLIKQATFSVDPAPEPPATSEPHLFAHNPSPQATGKPERQVSQSEPLAPKTPDPMTSILPTISPQELTNTRPSVISTSLRQANQYWQAGKPARLRTQEKIRARILWLLTRLWRLPRPIRLTLVGLIALSALALWHPWNQTDRPSSSSPAETTPTSSPDSGMEARSKEKLTFDLPPTRSLLTHEAALASVALNDTVLIVTRTSIEIPSTGASISLPAGSGVPRHIAPMSDLNLLFLLTDTGKLFAWSLTNQAFTENTLPVAAHTLGRIGSYLTYLYALSPDGTTLTRFPRAPDGFGDGTTWFKESLTPDTDASFVVNENVLIFSNSALTEYSRGKTVRVFDTPVVKPERLLIGTQTENSLVVGLDVDYQRLIVWNTEGHITAQYFSPTLADAISLTLRGRTVTISTPGETFSVDLP